MTAAPALAQTSLNPSERVATPLTAAAITPASSVPPLPAPEALFPDAFGAGPWLRDRGVAVLLDNLDEYAGNVTGYKKGSTNLGQYGLENDIDWEKLAGLKGFATHALVIGRYGIPASPIWGDGNLSSSQDAWGAGGNVAVHLVYAYGEETLAGGRVDIAAGRMPLLNDFASSPLYCNFMNNAFCGNPKAASDNIAYSSYPDSNWAMRVRVRPTGITYVQTGLFFVEQNIYQTTNGARSGFRFDSQEISGTSIPAEIGIEPTFGADKLPGHYKIGAIYARNNASENYYDRNGQPFALSGLPPRQSAGQLAEYVTADQMVLRHGPGAANGLILFATYFHNNDDTSLRNHFASVGMTDHGFWKARPLDGISAALSYTRVSRQLRDTEALQRAYGLPITGRGGQFYNGQAQGVQDYGMTAELNYQIHVWRGVTFAPVFEYYIHPNAVGSVPDAAMFGFKSHIEIF